MRPIAINFNNYLQMTSVSQQSTGEEGVPIKTSTSGTSKTTFTSSVEMTPGLTSTTRTSFIEDDDEFPSFQPIMLQPPSTFFNPFFAQQPMFRPFPSLFDTHRQRVREVRESRPKRRTSTPQIRPVSSSSDDYNSSNSSSSINCNNQQPIYEFPETDDTTPINSPVPSMASSTDTQSSSKSFKDSLIRVLDEVDARVRFLRDTANELEEEKEKLLSTLSNLEKRNELSMIEESE